MSSHKGSKVKKYLPSFRSDHISIWNSSCPKIFLRTYAELNGIPVETFRRWTKGAPDIKQVSCDTEYNVVIILRTHHIYHPQLRVKVIRGSIFSPIHLLLK